MRGLESKLEGSLIRGLPEVRKQVADLLLAGIENLASGGGVDRVRHVLTEFLEAAAQLVEKVLGGKLGVGLHRRVSQGEGLRWLAVPRQPLAFS